MQQQFGAPLLTYFLCQVQVDVCFAHAVDVHIRIEFFRRFGLLHFYVDLPRNAFKTIGHTACTLGELNAFYPCARYVVEAHWRSQTPWPRQVFNS